MPPVAQPDHRLASEVEAIGQRARRDVVAAFRGVPAVDLAGVWPDAQPKVRDAILGAQRGAIGATETYLTDLAGSAVLVDATPWDGRIGDKPLTDWLEVTPGAHRARLAGGMTASEAAAATAGFLASRAEGEAHRVAREAVAVTAARDPRFVGWARVAEPGACAFCRMLATRGAVYTEETVLRTFGGLKYHHKRPNGSGGECKCRAVALPRGTGDTTWDGTGAPGGRRVAKVPQQALTRLQDVEQQLTVLRGQVANGTATAWTEQRIVELEAERIAAGGKPIPVPTVAEAVADAAAKVADEQPVAAVAADILDADSARRLTNEDLDARLQAAWEADDWHTADVLEAEMERRQKWAADWGQTYDDYLPLDDVATSLDDLPDYDDVPEPPRLTRREIRAEWEAEQQERYWRAEEYGASIRSDMAAEARAKGIDLWRLMTGDPRTAYKYANEELLQWWEQNGGRSPLWEREATHGRIDSRTLAQRRLTEDKARALAQELIGKNREEAMAARDAEQHRRKRAKSRATTEGDRLAAAQRKYQRARKVAGP